MEMVHYSKTLFAENAGVDRSTINRSLRGHRIHEEEDGRIDPRHPMNIKYLMYLVDRKKGKGLSIAFMDIVEQHCSQMLPPAAQEGMRRPRRGSVPDSATIAKNYDDMLSRLGADVNAEPEEKDRLFDTLMSQGLLQPGEQLKVAQTTLANLRIAKEMDDLIARDLVKKCFARLSGIIASRLLCLGQRSTKEICAVFGDMSPEKEIAVQRVVDDEVAGAVEAIQREIIDVSSEW